MPSRFEPCGLSQMMAMRYGPYHWFMRSADCEILFNRLMPIDGSGTGFSFNNLSGYWFNWAVDEALAVYYS